MGRHKEWRRIAKKERRRKIRILQAKERDGVLDPESIEYEDWLREQKEIELFEIEQVLRANEQENEKWSKADKLAMQQWQKLQEHKERVRIQQLEEEIRLKLEWELEKERKREDEKRLKEIEEENRIKQELFMQQLEQFLSGHAVEPPQELLISRETKPDCESCPFFIKTACCRFGEKCSRNHRYPGISNVLLAANFYSHFGLENANDYDTDIMLEYEDSDTYKEFREFFYDVVPEFEKFGKITQFKVSWRAYLLMDVCNNYEKHLRGNTYVEFAELRCAVAAYRSLHARWYGGKQLSLQFCLISSWKNAICGLQARNRCPKGRACNLLHVFRNPNNLFNYRESIRDSARPRKRTPPRSWRWSESPEPEKRDRRRSRSRERRDRRRRGIRRHEYQDTKHKSNRSNRHERRRSKSSDRSKNK